VTFHNESRLAALLSSAPDPTIEALFGVALQPGTRIDRGLLTALAELNSPRRRAGNQAVVVLLTDGRPTAGASDQDVVDAAQRLFAMGARVFVIGLGEDVDPALLGRVASSRYHLYLAPEADALIEIYAQIGGVIPCG
jgi:hypothetical protein